MGALPPLSVYVHLPWCVAKCPYCDFNSHVAPSSLPEEQYVDALLADLRFDCAVAADRQVQSVFFGGGTPSLFTPSAIARFMTGLRATVSVARDLEVTLEANPGTIEHGRFAGYLQAGVTRISLGIQSFDDRQLKTLGRIHDSAQATAAVAELRAAGIDNFNLDLMYGLPGQSLAAAQEDLHRALELGPAHLSHYQLTMEPGTVFYTRRPALPDDDLTFEMQIACQEMLAAHGYAQYEVSGYSRPSRRCLHNLNYWQFGDYAGVGAGAHGKWTSMGEHGLQIVRTTRRKQPREYLASNDSERLVERSVIEPRDLPFEFALNALRLNEGFARSLFESRTGIDLSMVADVLRAAKHRGLIAEVENAIEDPIVRATDLGRRFLNDLTELFLPGAVG